MVVAYRQDPAIQRKEPTMTTTDTKGAAALAEAEALASKGKADAKKPEAKPAKTEKKADAAKGDGEKAKAPAKPAKTEAELQAEKALKEAEALAKKAAKDAEAERFRKVTLANLEKDAKEINVRFEKAEQMAGKADDMRLAAAILLADSKERCREAKIKFEDWCAENIKQSYETVRKLIPIGTAENEKPGAGKLLLEDMRSANAERNRKHRAEAKATALLVKIEDATKTTGDKATGAGTLGKAAASLKTAMESDATTLEVLTDKIAAASEAYTEFKKANGIGKRPELTPEQKAAHAGANGDGAAPKRNLSDLERVEQVVNTCAKDVKQNVVKTVAEAQGFRCITEEESKKFAALKKHDELSTKDKIEQLFSRLTGKEQAAIASWVAAPVGGSFVPAS